ncbi:MAG: D-alanine--D-alanine ligase [Myxococcaceae bacterium]|nr:D-alanine--D-alanine ligase [Myxococcaceae bacterium]
MGKQRIGVVMGGWGEERGISLKTGEAVARALESRGYPVTRMLAGDDLPEILREVEIDIAFVALHGRMGEDGRVQGLLEVMGIPYTGSGVLASALAMNKPYAKKLFRLANLATPTGYTLTARELDEALERHLDLGFPCVVKPARGGSSVGVSVVHHAEELTAAVAGACRYGGEVLVERFIKGREVTVGIVDGEVLGCAEIAHGTDAFDYATKYEKPARLHIPPRLSPTRVSNVEAMALAAYRALNCRGYARVDFICADSGDNDVLLEVNTLPGLTATSLLPKMARHAGLTFETLIERIVLTAGLDDGLGQPPRPLRREAPEASISL